tara:strand:- start:213 stop:536 length:324 start_codon:yes stop_codon:yes gene_type:complete
MTWIEVTINGTLIRIDSVNPLLIQRWREYVRKPDDWEEAKIYRHGKAQCVYLGGETELIERIVYKAHNPNWKNHYSRHNIIMYKDGNKEDFSIENLMIKPTEGLRRY